LRVLLTGGYGCIGCWIAKNLIEHGQPVWVYDLKEDLRRMRQVLDEEQVAQVRFCPGDVTDLAALKATLERQEITHIVHLAGLQVPICRADPLLGAKVNVLGTLAVFEAVKALQPQVRGLVYASSAAVFGPAEEYGETGTRGHGDTETRGQGDKETRRPGDKGNTEPAGHSVPLSDPLVTQSHPLPDHVPLKPTTHYGVFKVANEGNARVYWQDHGIASIGLRPWTVYGVGRDFGMTSEPTKAIKCVALGRPYHISYGGIQDLQFTDDVAKTFLRCLEAPYQGAGVYNLRGTVVDLPTFRRTLIEVAPDAAKLITHGDRQLAIAYDLSDQGLQRDVGGIPRTELREGIRQTLARFRSLLAAGRLDTSDLG
jgi:nucleoside-diphosphate-sugar epimerase